jgi:hypothetical protein
MGHDPHYPSNHRGPQPKSFPPTSRRQRPSLCTVEPLRVETSDIHPAKFFSKKRTFAICSRNPEYHHVKALSQDRKAISIGIIPVTVTRSHVGAQPCVLCAGMSKGMKESQLHFHPSWHPLVWPQLLVVWLTGHVVQLICLSVSWLLGWLVGGFCNVDCMVYKCNRLYLEINYKTELLLVLMKCYDRNPHKQAATDVL